MKNTSNRNSTWSALLAASTCARERHDSPTERERDTQFIYKIENRFVLPASRLLGLVCTFEHRCCGYRLSPRSLIDLFVLFFCIQLCFDFIIYLFVCQLRQIDFVQKIGEFIYQFCCLHAPLKRIRRTDDQPVGNASRII